MSSIQTKDSSLKKAVCIGLIFSKDFSFIHFLNTTVQSSRSLLLSVMEIFCVVMGILVNMIRNLTGGVSVEKLDKFMIKINQQKVKHQSYSVKKAMRLNQSESNEKTSSSIEQKQPELRRDENPSDVKDQQKYQLKLRIISHATIAYVYSQFVFILYLIGLTQFRIGFIFLLLCTLCINYMILEISFIKKQHSQLPTNRQSRRDNPKREKKMKTSLITLFSGIQVHSRRIGQCLQKAKLP